MISQRTSRRSAVWAGVALAFAFAISAAHAQDVIKIAAGAPLTGPLAKQGQEGHPGRDLDCLLGLGRPADERDSRQDGAHHRDDPSEYSHQSLLAS